MTGVVLAGGRSSRMKTNKAFLEIRETPLIENSLDMLQGIFAEVLISSNEPRLYARYGLPVILDNVAGQGPLGGLQACLEASKYEAVFFAACDMPFLQKDVIVHLAQWAADYDIVVPCTASGGHYLHAFYSKRCLPVIEKNLKAHSFKVKSIYDECRVRYVQEEELRQFGDPEHILCNINTMAEWSKLKQE